MSYSERSGSAKIDTSAQWLVCCWTFYRDAQSDPQGNSQCKMSLAPE